MKFFNIKEGLFLQKNFLIFSNSTLIRLGQSDLSKDINPRSVVKTIQEVTKHPKYKQGYRNIHSA